MEKSVALHNLYLGTNGRLNSEDKQSRVTILRINGLKSHFVLHLKGRLKLSFGNRSFSELSERAQTNPQTLMEG
jgi:hypothetical protein